jgi:hypothetical protein
MAFGIMTSKWGILHQPLRSSLAQTKYIALAIARLHNYTIRERIVMGTSDDWQRTNHTNIQYATTVPDRVVNGGDIQPIAPIPPPLEPNIYHIRGFSRVRHLMVNRVAQLGVFRPLQSAMNLRRPTQNT